MLVSFAMIVEGPLLMVDHAVVFLMALMLVLVSFAADEGRLGSTAAVVWLMALMPVW